MADATLLLALINLVSFFPFGWIVLFRILLFEKKKTMAIAVFIDGNELEINAGGVQKRIPLRQITDLTINDGPIMRRHGISRLTVMTSGAADAGAFFLGTNSEIQDARVQISQAIEAQGGD